MFEWYAREDLPIVQSGLEPAPNMSPWTGMVSDVVQYVRKLYLQDRNLSRNTQRMHASSAGSSGRPQGIDMGLHLRHIQQLSLTRILFDVMKLQDVMCSKRRKKHVK